MDRRGYGLGAWKGSMLFEKDVAEVFGSLNFNFTFFSILDSFKRDFGIHIAIGFLFPFDDLERIS